MNFRRGDLVIVTGYIYVSGLGELTEWIDGLDCWYVQILNGGWHHGTTVPIYYKNIKHLNQEEDK